MNEAFKVTFTELDLTFSVTAIVKGISGVEGITLRGPMLDPKDVVRNYGQFEKLFGGFLPTSDFPLLCYRALNKGVALRVNRLGHCTNITDKTTLDAVKAAMPEARLLTFSDALVTANDYNLTINGTPIAQVTFATNSDTTMAAIAASIQAHADVATASVVTVSGGSSNDRSILIIPIANTTLTLTGSAVTNGASQATTTDTAVNAIWDSSGNPLFVPAIKYHGSDYNNVSIVISAATNGNADYFNMAIIHALEPELNESYQNLTINNNGGVNYDAAHSTFLNAVIQSTQLIDFTYLDLSALSGQLRPLNGTYQFFGGSNGSSLVATDYIGDSTGQTGLYTFDNYNDMMQICAPEISDMTVHAGGAIYAAGRKDLVYFAHISNALVTANDIITARQSSGIDTRYCAFFGGGLKCNHPITNLPIQISELGDILGLAANSDSAFGEWYSFAGPQRGVITGATGVVNNFGGNGQITDLDALAAAGINMIISRDNKIMLWGNYTAQLANSLGQKLNVVRLDIFLKKSLKPTLERYIQEPNDPQSWLALYREVEPFLESMVVKRAFYEPATWDGDQFVTNLADLKVNNANDVQQGKYKIKMYYKPIPGIEVIGFYLIKTPAGVSIEDIA